MYSGYIDIANTTKKIHYLLTESKNDRTKDPLIIWFNGGPGCSSMLGLLQELGPYLLEDGETEFFENPYSWNNEASILYIEQPAGVGYSYCNSTEDCTFDDDSSAADNLKVLLSWFEKFPEYQNHELYISGESYAGVYVPLLVNEIDKHNN